jgi:hypothetical protein
LTSVGSIRADVSRRPLIFAALLAVVMTACSDLPQAEVDFGSGLRFVPYVVDAIDDVGLGAAVATNPDGLPYVSSFGFPQELSEGEIAPARPIGSPFLPAVLLATTTADGQWDRGAVIQTKPEVEPVGVGVSFGPETVDGLEMDAESTNGTAVAVAADGTVHVAWTAPDGVWYASTMQGGPTSVEQIYDYGVALTVAGPIGRPGIAVDADGTPWIAYAVNAGPGLEVRVATPGTDGWDEQVAFTAGRCNGCPQPGPTGIVIAGGAPTVGFIDPSTSQLQVAALAADGWTSSSTVDAGEGARGLSMSVDGDAAVAAFYGAGSVRIMGSDGAVSDVAAASPEGPDTGTLAPTTGIVSDGNGSLYVAWQDAAGVHLASGTSGAFSEVETSSTEAGASPAVAVGSSGAVFLAWFDTEKANLEVGVLGDPQDVVVARPSPSITVSAGPAPSAGCGEDGKIALDIVAKGIAWDTTCLVAPANEAFTINIDNQDAGIPHNLDLFTEAGGTSIAATELQAGPVQQTLDVDPLEAGEYYFQCDAHPTTMTGTLVAIDTGKGNK